MYYIVDFVKVNVFTVSLIGLFCLLSLMMAPSLTSKPIWTSYGKFPCTATKLLLNTWNQPQTVYQLNLLITNKICNIWPWICLSQWPNYVWASENGGLFNTFFNSLKRLTQYLSWAPLIKTGSHIDCIFSYLLGGCTKAKWSIHCREAKATGGTVAQIAVNGKTTQQHLKILFLRFEGGGHINC